MNSGHRSLDRAARTQTAQGIAFVWGLAEATVFFIVPDVFLTFVACRDLRSALKTTVAAVCGALVGGLIMYSFGQRAILLRVPGIHPDLIASVDTELSSRKLNALLAGLAKRHSLQGLRRGMGTTARQFAHVLVGIDSRPLDSICAERVGGAGRRETASSR